MENNNTTLIHAARLADGVSKSSQHEQGILVADGRITAVGPTAQIKQNARPDIETINLGDVTITPGLIDGHTHLSLAGDGRDYAAMFSENDEMMMLTGAHNLQLHLAAGITTLREHGARNKVGFLLKEGLSRGYIAGPRMQVSGRPITCTGGHFHICNEEADGPGEIRRSVRRLVHEGADYLKIMASGGGTAGTIPGRASFSVEELHAAVHEAHHFHKLTAAHCRAKESMQRAVEAGIDLMEHAEFLDPDHQMRFDPDLADKMAECDIWISPTLQAWTQYERIVELESKQVEDDLTEFEESELQSLRARAETRLEVMRRMLEHCKMERIVPGTDSGVGSLCFGHLDYDLRLLVEVGFTPGEALLSATRISAEALGIERDLGTIEPGKVADLAAFKGDPTEDVLALSEVVAVFQGGVRVS